MKNPIQPSNFHNFNTHVGDFYPSSLYNPAIIRKKAFVVRSISVWQIPTCMKSWLIHPPSLCHSRIQDHFSTYQSIPPIAKYQLALPISWYKGDNQTYVYVKTDLFHGRGVHSREEIWGQRMLESNFQGGKSGWTILSSHTQASTREYINPKISQIRKYSPSHFLSRT